ncbi:hypothetical protein HPB47_017265 [Ixodes persulcatus]|uniref:Uncharacterized protein n=1 Tax=Ixodes persulcatus TaxID=34615 RepID=A0AC60QNR1_IXOPE|nr:hypothetical protein HPB47_017265 [Ixodes persulcatus]
MENSDGEPSSNERQKSGPSTAALAKDQAGQPGQQRTSGQAVKGVKRRKGENDDEPDDDDQEENIGASEATSDSTMYVDEEKNIADAATVNKLLKVRSLYGVAVQATIPKTYMRNNGLVTGVPDWYSDSELTEFLEPAGVIAARRLYQRRAKVGEAAKPTDRVVLTFRPNTKRPVRVSPGFTIHEVCDYVESPSRCFNCQALGHIAKYCKNAVKCKKCAGQHATKECKGEDPVKCANRGGDHPASYVNCKVRLGALARSKAFVNGPRQALKPVETVEVNDTAASQKSPVATVAISKPTDSQTTSGMKPQEGRRKYRKTNSASKNRTGKQTQLEEEFPPLPPRESQVPNVSQAHLAPSSTGRRLYSRATENVPPPPPKRETDLPGVSNVNDIVSLLFSALRGFLAQLPPGHLKMVLQGIMVFEVTITDMIRNWM